jgi:hypothetical protein
MVSQWRQVIPLKTGDLGASLGVISTSASKLPPDDYTVTLTYAGTMAPGSTNTPVTTAMGTLRVLQEVPRDPPRHESVHIGAIAAVSLVLVALVLLAACAMRRSTLSDATGTAPESVGLVPVGAADSASARAPRGVRRT